MVSNAAIECTNLTVDFGATRALDRVSLSVDSGKILGIVGPNGAGKSTLGRVIVGEIPFGRYEGELRFDGQTVEFRSVRHALNHPKGPALIHQEGFSVDALTLGENVMLMIEPRRGLSIDWERLHREASQHMSSLGMEVDSRTTLGKTSGVALRHQVDAARAVARGSKIFVFDESTAAMGIAEVARLLEKMRELKASGAAVLFISHRLNEVLRVSDRIIVMRDGRIVADAPQLEMSHDKIVRAFTGTGNSELRPLDMSRTVDRTGSKEVFQLREWRVPRHPTTGVEVGPIDIIVHSGELLGIFGALGAGKSELLGSLFGLQPRRRSHGERLGEAKLDGKSIRFASPMEALRSGVAFIPADRRSEGILPAQTIRDNIMAAARIRQKHRRLIDWDAEEETSRRLVDLLDIKITSIDQRVDQLSGGNQQKVLLARSLAVQPRMVLCDEPTRGVDVGAKLDVYHALRRMVKEGACCIFASMEPEEMVLLADRVVVLRDGEQVGVLAGAEITEENLVRMSY